MTNADFILVVLIVLGWSVGVSAFLLAYREGWGHGYSAGYDDRDDEVIYGEDRGTRRGRTTDR